MQFDGAPVTTTTIHATRPVAYSATGKIIMYEGYNLDTQNYGSLLESTTEREVSFAGTHYGG